MARPARATGDGTETASIRELDPGDRKLFLTLVSPKELRGLFPLELGYIGPSLGIVRDGTWWFFEGGNGQSGPSPCGRRYDRTLRGVNSSASHPFATRSAGQSA